MSDTKKIVCPKCHAANRVPAGRLGDRPVCGKCRQALLPTEPLSLGDFDFQTMVSRTEIPVWVDFWAPWCGPCKMMAPQFAEAARRLSSEMVLAKVNTQEAERIAGALQISSIPTMILFLHGQEIARQSGAMNSQQIVQWARSALHAHYSHFAARS